MRQNISVPYKDRELAKLCGAKWDRVERTWYIDRSKTSAVELTQAELERFGRWCKVPQKPVMQFTPTKWCPAWKPK